MKTKKKQLQRLFSTRFEKSSEQFNQRTCKPKTSKYRNIEDLRKGIEKLKDENIRLKTKYKYIKVIKVTDNLYNRKQIWQVETRKLRENINTNSSQKMINWTKYYEALGTEEDTS